MKERERERSEKEKKKRNGDVMIHGPRPDRPADHLAAFVSLSLRSVLFFFSKRSCCRSFTPVLLVERCVE